MEQSARSVRGHLLLWAAVFAPIVLAYALLGRFLTNAPWEDDYLAILEFSLRFERQQTLAAKLRYLIEAQHTNYKLVFEHAVVVLQLGLLHHVNFWQLVVAGNLFLLGIAGLVWKMSFPREPDRARRLKLFLPIVILLFSLNYSETLDWAMGSLQNLPVIFFSLLALDLLTTGRRRGWPITAASIAAVLACLSSANGFVLVPIGLAILVERRAFRAAAGWCLAIAVAVAAYLDGYRDVLPRAHVPIYGKPLFFLSVLGDAAPQSLLIPLGAVLLGVFLWALRERYWRNNPYATAVGFWIAGTAAMIAEGRASYGLDAAYASRYKIYSSLFLIVCYGFLVKRLQPTGFLGRHRRTAYAAVVGVAALYLVRSDWAAWKLLSQRKNDLRVGMTHYLENPQVNPPVDPIRAAEDPNAELKRRILVDSKQAGLFDVEQP